MADDLTAALDQIEADHEAANAFGANASDPVPRLLGALRAVLKLHQPGRVRKSYDLDLRCQNHPPERGWLSEITDCPDCSYREYSRCAHGCEGDGPCPTVQAVITTLAGQEASERGNFTACPSPEASAEPRVISEPATDNEPWWCDCPDRKGPHVHMPNWGGQGSSIALTALVDTETGMEIPGSRKGGSG